MCSMLCALCSRTGRRNETLSAPVGLRAQINRAFSAAVVAIGACRTRPTERVKSAVAVVAGRRVCVAYHSLRVCAQLITTPSAISCDKNTAAAAVDDGVVVIVRPDDDDIRHRACGVNVAVFPMRR